MKTCSKCKISKELDDFYKKKQSLDGYDFWCKDCWRNKKQTKRTRKTNYPDLIPSYQFNQLWSNTLKRSALKKLEHTITKEELYEKVLEFCQNNKHSWLPKDPFKPSIDRINPSEGYTKSNVKVIWLIENYCKNTFTEEQVIEFCKEKLKQL